MASSSQSSLTDDYQCSLDMEKKRRLADARLPYDVHADDTRIELDPPALERQSRWRWRWRLYVVRQLLAFALFYVMCALGQIMQLFSYAVIAPFLGMRAHRCVIEVTQIYFVEGLMAVYNASDAPSGIEITGATRADADWLRNAAARASASESHADADGERAIIISNHITMLDWIFIWFAFFLIDRSGHIKIILKDSFKLIPVLGLGMYFFEFIFLSRQWTQDMKTLDLALTRLRETGRTPRLLLLFPEGTLLTRNRILASLEYSIKSGIPFQPYSLIPRTTGAWHIFERLRADGACENENQCQEKVKSMSNSKSKSMPMAKEENENRRISHKDEDAAASSSSSSLASSASKKSTATTATTNYGGFTHVYNLTITFDGIPPHLLPDDVVKFSRIIYAPYTDVHPTFRMKFQRLPISCVPRTRAAFDEWMYLLFREKSQHQAKCISGSSSSSKENVNANANANANSTPQDESEGEKTHVGLKVARLPPVSLWRPFSVIFASVIIAVVTQALARAGYLILTRSLSLN